jgi:photosystem II stability/assembly factor-like uncharacterized protein
MLPLAAALLWADDIRPIPLRNPADKAAELRQYHLPDVKAMPSRVRLEAFAQRQAMQARSPFARLPWTNIGPTVQGGRVVDIESPKNLPNQTLVGYATGGLWRTETDGDTWEPLFDYESSFGIGDFAVSDDGKTIWIGAGENNSQRTSYSGLGMYKSTDAGASWQHMGLEESHHIGKVIIHPSDVDTVYVASIGPLYSQGGQRGIFKTTNGGRTWEQVLKTDDRTGVIDLEMDPRNPYVLYAAAWERDRRAWNILEGGPGSAIYKSMNGGKTWIKLSGLPEGVNLGRAGLAISPSRPDRVYMFAENTGPDLEQDLIDERTPSGQLTLLRLRSMTASQAAEAEGSRAFIRRYLPADTEIDGVMKGLQDGSLSMTALFDLFLRADPGLLDRRQREAEVWRSDDAGRTWKNVSGRMGSHGGYYWNKIEVDPQNPDVVYTTGVPLLRSTDGGATWESIARRNHVDHHALFIDPRRPGIMWNGNDGGVYISRDNGENWRHLNSSMPVGQFTTIAVDTKEPFNVYGGLQDNGTMRGPVTHNPDRDDINDWTAIGGGDGSMIQVDPRNGGDLVYIASQFGAFQSLNQATGQRRSVRPRGAGLRFNWLAPILISPHHPDIIYVGSQKLHRSFNQGQDYTDLSGDLTKDLPNGDVPFSTLTQISESPFTFGRIYVAADDGSIKTTPDGGITWTDISTPAKDRWVTRLTASTHKEGRLYASQNGYRQDEWTPYVWVSEDHGATWTSIASNLPFEPVNTLREDPKNPNVLYVGTDMGVYVSLDRGQRWHTVGGGIPNTPVHDLAVHPRDGIMVIASHARSVWKFDVKPIQNLTAEAMAKPLDILSSSADAVSGLPYRRKPEYAGPGAPDALARAQFWSNAAGAVTAELVGEDGKVAATVQMEAGYGFNDLSMSLRISDEKPVPVGATAPPKTAQEALADPHAALRAVYVPAGSYTLRITRGSEKAEASLRIR